MTGSLIKLDIFPIILDPQNYCFSLALRICHICLEVDTVKGAEMAVQHGTRNVKNSTGETSGVTQRRQEMFG